MSLPWPTLTTDEWNALIANTKATTKHDLRAMADSSIIELGGPGSGNFGHVGRPGEVGGSGGDGGGGDRGVGSGTRLPLQADPTPDDFIAARNKSTRPGYLSPLSVDDLKGQKLYLSKDGTVGGAMTPEGDMGNLFNNGGPKGAAHEVLIQMIKDGGKTADAFDGYLPTLYANFGLQETGRMTFNPEYAPPGWNFERDDNPDVVFLARTSEAAEEAGSADDIRGRVKDKTKWIAPKRSPTYHDDYDAAKRDALTRADAGGARSLGAFRDGAWQGVGGEARGADVGGSTRTGRSVTDPFRLGGEGSGNFGHAGRKGEVGGSAKTEGTTGITFEQQGDQLVGKKKDGGTVLTKPGPISAETMTKVFGDHKIETVVGQMVEDLPGDFAVTYKENAGGGEIIVRAASRNGTTEMMRVFRQDEGGLTVQHHFFEVSDELQGKNVAKAVMADSMHAYKQMGVDRIVMHANIEVGGYAWAKFGFMARNPGKLAGRVSEVLHGLGNTIAPSERAAMDAVITQYKDDPKLPWHVAGLVASDGRKVGKELLMKSAWDATLPLNNPEAMARFAHYTGGH